MPRIALTIEQKKACKIIGLAEWISGRMRMLGLRQSDLAKALNITQAAVSKKLRASTYKENKNADPFSYGELLILFDLLGATPEERLRLMTI